MNWKYIFNPFLKFSETILLIIGLISVVLGSYFGSYFSINFDGIFDAHLSSDVTFLQSLQENIINVLVVFTLLLILGKIIYKKTRIIDIITISMVYRIPLYFTTFLISNPTITKVNEKIMKDIQNSENLHFDLMEMGVLIIVTILSILFLIYSIILLTNGFKNSTNLKKWQNYVWFVVILIIAEIISKVLINLI